MKTKNQCIEFSKMNTQRGKNCLRNRVYGAATKMSLILLATGLHFTLLIASSATDMDSNLSFVFFDFMLFSLPVVNILNSVKHLVHLIHSSLTVHHADTKISFLPDDLGWNRSCKFPVYCSGAQHLSKLFLHIVCSVALGPLLRVCCHLVPSQVFEEPQMCTSGLLDSSSPVST